MEIEYREVRAGDDLSQCLELQRRVFQFSDPDLVSPLFFKLIERNAPPIGLALGVFETGGGTSRLIGLMLGFATFIPDSVYTVMLGIMPEYQDGMLGYKLLWKFRELALSRGVRVMFGVFDPLEASLGRLYFGGCGFRGTTYNPDRSEAAVPHDTVLVKWVFAEQGDARASRRPAGSRERLSWGHLPIATAGFLPDVPRVLTEIPSACGGLAASDSDSALDCRLRFRSVLLEYLNIRGYVMVDCVSEKVDGQRKSWYILEKENKGAIHG